MDIDAECLSQQNVLFCASLAYTEEIIGQAQSNLV